MGCKLDQWPRDSQKGHRLTLNINKCHRQRSQGWSAHGCENTGWRWEQPRCYSLLVFTYYTHMYIWLNEQNPASMIPAGKKFSISRSLSSSAATISTSWFTDGIGITFQQAPPPPSAHKAWKCVCSHYFMHWVCVPNANVASRTFLESLLSFPNGNCFSAFAPHFYNTW